MLGILFPNCIMAISVLVHLKYCDKSYLLCIFFFYWEHHSNTVSELKQTQKPSTIFNLFIIIPKQQTDAHFMLICFVAKSKKFTSELPHAMYS